MFTQEDWRLRRLELKNPSRSPKKKKQCCGSGTLIPDPGSEFIPSRIRIFYHPGSRIRIFSIPGPRSPSKRLIILTLKMFLSSRKNDLGCPSRIPDPDFFFISDPDPGLGVKKAPDPGWIRNTEKNIAIFINKFFPCSSRKNNLLTSMGR
jgi:hypothetical protein